MAKVPNGIETLPKISIVWVGRTNVTDRQTTDGRTTTYSEHELEFTFAKNHRSFVIISFIDASLKVPLNLIEFTHLITANSRLSTGRRTPLNNLSSLIVLLCCGFVKYIIAFSEHLTTLLRNAVKNVRWKFEEWKQSSFHHYSSSQPSIIHRCEERFIPTDGAIDQWRHQLEWVIPQQGEQRAIYPHWGVICERQVMPRVQTFKGPTE